MNDRDHDARGFQDFPIRRLRMRILVIDDCVDSTDALLELFTIAGHDVRAAHDGIAGLACAVDWFPDLVFVDLGLPLMGGLTVARKLRERRRRVRLVALTGRATEADRQVTLSAGFDEFITKPVSLDVIEAIADSVAETVHAAQALRHA